MSRFCLRLMPLILFVLPTLASAQFDTGHPGYFPIEDLDLFPEEAINLEINLTGTMLEFIALATGEEEPELARLVENLESIRVRGAEIDSLDRERLRSGIAATVDRLADSGWTSMVRIREEGEEIHVFFKEKNGEMQGLTVLSLEEDEAMLINLVGGIDPTQLGRLASGLDLPQLEQSLSATEGEGEQP